MGSATPIARCPAKINLALHVLGRRDDGYHELDTVFQAVDLWDTLAIAPADDLTLACDDPRLPTDESNLVLRAARMVIAGAGGAARGARLRLRKRIPIGGGLGGGSSDAAGALLLCSRFWRLEFTRAELEAMAAELGADVPFFLAGGTARGRGRGDRIEPLPAAPDRAVLLGCPPFGVSTRLVFERLASVLTLPRNGGSFALPFWHKWPKDNDFRGLANDLEQVAFESWPELRSFRDALLEAGSGAALLSGSGSTVFGIFSSDSALAAAERSLGSRFPHWQLVRTRFVRAAAHLAPPPHGGHAGSLGHGHHPG